MGDERVVDEVPDKLASLETAFQDYVAQELARRGRKPTGDIEPTIRNTPKQNTLLCQGQSVSRTDYADLWAFAQEQGIVTGGLFGNGDGSTTFTLPDMRGRVPRGAGTLGSDTYALGATGGLSSVTLALTQIPAHGHAVDVADHGTHTHTFTGSATGTAGNHSHTGSTSGGDHTHTNASGAGGTHSGHNAGSRNVASALPGSQDFIFSVANTTQNGSGDHTHNVNASGGAHSHPVTVNAGGDHTHTVTGSIGATSAGAHTVTQSNAGGGQAHENRSPFIAVNWLIWI